MTSKHIGHRKSRSMGYRVYIHRYIYIEREREKEREREAHY